MVCLIDIWLKLPSPGITELERLGVSFHASQKIGGVRASHVRYGDRHLDALVTEPGYSATSEPELILPVFVDPPSIWLSIDDPALIDLVAFNPQNPNRWQTARGEGVMLGEAAYWEALDDGLELPVFRNPLEWLQAAGAGVVPLHKDGFADTVVGHPLLQLVGCDLEHGEQLHNQLQQHPRVDLPEIRVAA